MPVPDYLPFREDGSLRPFTADEVAEMEIYTRGVVDGSHPTHSREYGQSTVTRELRCRFDQFERFNCYMLGASVTYYDEIAGATRISRLLPQRDPEVPEFVATKLTSAKGAGGPGIDDPELNYYPSYPYMDCTYQFEHVPFEVRADDEITEEYQRWLVRLPAQPDVQYLTLPGGVMHFLRKPTDPDPGAMPTGRPVPYNIGFPHATEIVAYKWVRVPYEVWLGPGSPIWDRVHGNIAAGKRPYVGTINSHEILGYAPGTLLFLGVEEELKRDPLGAGFSWDLTFRWQWDGYGHHQKYFFESGTTTSGANGWYLVTRTTNTTWYDVPSLPDDTGIFNVRDHRWLFRPTEEPVP
jgi:hypothetical protein